MLHPQVHFDLKPDNLLLDTAIVEGAPTPSVKVADFGLSKQKWKKYVSGVRDLRWVFPFLFLSRLMNRTFVQGYGSSWI